MDIKELFELWFYSLKEWEMILHWANDKKQWFLKYFFDENDIWFYTWEVWQWTELNIKNKTELKKFISFLKVEKPIRLT